MYRGKSAIICTKILFFPTFSPPFPGSFFLFPAFYSHLLFPKASPAARWAGSKRAGAPAIRRSAPAGSDLQPACPCFSPFCAAAVPVFTLFYTFPLVLPRFFCYTGKNLMLRPGQAETHYLRPLTFRNGTPFPRIPKKKERPMAAGGTSCPSHLP